jgi:23S rRNA pseudouridine1911/1915/1917 synthase
MAAEPLVLQVADSDGGTRLDSFLAGPLGSRARAQRLIDAGLVRVEGRLVPKRHVVRAGETVEVEVERQAAEGDRAAVPSAPFTIAFQDEFLLVVDKPPGVVVHPARGHREGTLSQALAGVAGGGDEPERAGIVHRLDRDTSGLLVVARSDAVHRQLRSLLSGRKLRREYLALVEGHPASRSGTIDAPIGRDRRDRAAMSIDTDTPRAARTHFEVEELLPDAALLRVVLDTGRTHQIRVHLAAIGLAVCGDAVYGNPARPATARLGLERQFLHAARLAFEHPVTHVQIDVRSELPEDLQRALRRARAAPR